MTVGTKAEIIDIRVDTAHSGVLADISSGLRPKAGCEKKLPTLLLYDEAGLRLFEDITYLDEYYLTNAEIEVLENYADEIAQRIQPGSVLVELGSGNLRKVNILLQAIDRLGKDVEYYAVDLSLPELQRTFAEIPIEGYKHVTCHGLFGTYDNALEWLNSSSVRNKPKAILWLGSSLGNFKRYEVPPFLAGFREAIRPGDTMLIGIDSCKDADRVYHAYNDRDNVTHEFILNGLKHANALMKKTAFRIEDWEVIGEYDKVEGRHHAFVSPRKDVIVDGVPIPQGERVRIEESYKYSRDEILKLWEEAGLAGNTVWSNARGDYGLHLVSKPTVFLPTKPEQYAAQPVPSMAEWRELWAAWDAVTRKMIPESELLSKPINLRNECIFYLGHIPTFLDIHLARATDGGPSDPAHFWNIFERGIDPDVDDPTKCHDHSELPESWPPLEKILQHQKSVRDRAEALYASGEAESNPRVARALWLGFEHEAMHLETLLYMLIQSEKVLPPPGTVAPDFQALARQSAAIAVPNEWFTVPEADIKIGLDDPERDTNTKRYFGWDNERPQRSVRVKSFRAKARPITNGEFAAYLAQTGKTKIPASWSEHAYTNNHNTSTSKRDSVINGHQNGVDGASDKVATGKYVRTVYGTVPLEYALDWPIMASYDELVGCAQWMGGRIPTMEEARSIYSYVDSLKAPEIEKALGNTIPAVNGHLINNGVDESPPSKPLSNGASGADSSPNPHDLFIDLEGANVGFKHWHPVSVTDKGNKLCGQSDLGGVWEWTSTVLERHEGFEPMALYPGYTADFFDGKHNVTLGGSWATHPRLAGRKTFVNWYQRNYPYVWAGARIAMFMRLRGHTCHYCRTIDEAHHGRHRRIAEGLRDVYESAGESDWTIIPSEPEERGRAREYNASSAEYGDNDRGSTPEDMTASKRERKDAKCLARAASRARVISADEILHIDSVIHSADGLLNGDTDGPCNVEEMEEIERHLKYNTHVYNSQRDRRDLKKFARLPDVDVDFDVEMERILEAFRVTELLKRNTRNRGLMGKELKTFLGHVEELKKMVVDDLVAVKKDALEIRMRRAGYLRYTNKTAHSIVEDRYANKDWKTGEKFSSSGSSSEDVASPIEDAESAPVCQSSAQATKSLPSNTKHTPDHRHLEKVHTRITGDDGLGQHVIEPYHAPLLPLPAIATSKPRAVQLKVVPTTGPSLGLPRVTSTRAKPRLTGDESWQTVIHAKKTAKPSVKPAWGMTAAGRTVAVPPPPVNPWGDDVCEIPDFRSFKSPAVQPTSATAKAKSDGPDGFIDVEPPAAHPVVSQKKAKKYEREARRKAKKAGDVIVNGVEARLQVPAALDASVLVEGTAAANPIADFDSLATLPSDAVVVKTTTEPLNTLEVDTTQLEITDPEPWLELACSTSPEPLFTTHHRKHMHWLRFERQFIVDQMTDPCLTLWAGCSHGTSCAFETLGVVDCPFHEPHCSCVDPQYDECYLVYPCPDILSCGPFNRLHGEKLLAKYEQDEHIKGRIMLVDSDLINYFMVDPRDRTLARYSSSVPKRLATEYADYANGYNPGPLMEQEKKFERLWAKNIIIKRQLSRDMLADVQQRKMENAQMDSYCYCHEIMPEDGAPKNVLECSHRDCPIGYFHKSCIKKLGADKVSRWFCTMCEQKMRTVAHQTLRDLGFDDVPNDEEDLNDSMDKIQDKFQIPDGAMSKLRSRIETMGGSSKVASVIAMAFNVGKT
ncbi:hypothetical protein FB567DRAFT_591382 [Paraphoma chrysanthemicola]|uniref:Uncharacterized protein n=1 Tax=Paraphoma chrysanthemicola TaxID=798071 RepID=A0A8K0VZN3_9PLEO|nr:hypothetical protein FB567DRAFT_591382 [Paraphoma chrysanthemicola]